MTWKCTNTPKGENKLYSDAKGVVPSLDLRFAEGKTLNDYMTATPLVDHQRSMSGSNLSAGTFVNSNGLIETAKVNLLTYSEDFTGTNWSWQGTAGIITSGFSSPAGNLTASKLITSSSISGRKKDLGPQGVSGVTNSSVIFNLLNGQYVSTVVGNPTYGSESISNGWYRYWLTANGYTFSIYAKSAEYTQIQLQAFQQFFYVYAPQAVGGNTTDGILIWGAQVEEGTTATTYIPTTNVPSAAPRFDHDPATGESLGLLIEESRTNLVTYSEQFDNAAWGATSAGTFVVTPNASLAPDGTTTADLVVGNNASTWITNNGGAASAGDYTFSVWLKSDTPQTAEILMSYGVTDILSCSVTTDWQRFTLTATRAASVALFVGVNVGNAKNIYIWGAQLEVGSFATSYIPTTGTALTRSTDTASITGSNFSSWYNPNETTLYIESLDFPNYSRLANGAFVYISDTNVFPISLNDGIKFGTGSPATFNRVFVTEAGVNYATTAGNQASKFAIAVATNDFNYVSDGISIGTATSVVMPTGMDRLVISSYGPGYAHISRLTYFPERLPDATLQTITTP